MSLQRYIWKITGSSAFPEVVFESHDRRHFYTNLELKDDSSLIIGPKAIRARFELAYNDVVENSSTEVSEGAEFENVVSLLHGLREDFGCIPHTAELIGLRSENGVHKYPVDIHTQQVVESLLKLTEFDKLDHRCKNIVETAAYLHDIGKGPRSRWDKNGGLQKVDPNHPVGAMPMIAEILTEHIRSIKKSDARSLIKLVCYHDLIGDVLGQDRDVQQILEIAENQSDLAMLFAIGKADVISLVPEWWKQDDADELYKYCSARI